MYSNSIRETRYAIRNTISNECVDKRFLQYGVIRWTPRMREIALFDDFEIADDLIDGHKLQSVTIERVFIETTFENNFEDW
jgi:hypothetical protein